MLMRSDPFRQLDRLAQEAFGTRMRPALMPLDAFRQGDRFVARFDLPGVDPESIDLTVEQRSLTVTAQRRWQPGEDVDVLAAERPQGTFSRQLLLGDGLDVDGLEARYEHGVLVVEIPLAERAKPRKITVTAASADAGGQARRAIDAPSTDAADRAA